MPSIAISPDTNDYLKNIENELLPIHVATEDTLQEAIKVRNSVWEKNSLIPSWVKLSDVGLDRFFTRPEVAQECYASLLEIMNRDYADTSLYRFIEPSAGDGVFYDLLPTQQRIGIDIVPERPEFEVADFLSWNPSGNKYRFAIVGNPPFGYRAWLALAFLNHAATFADYIGFILPMAFQSDGKGSPKHRVYGAELVATLPLPADAFITETGQPAGVNALWQVWRRGVNNRKPVLACDNWIDLFTVDMRPERLCGQRRLSEANWFLQRTFFNEPPMLVRRFEDVKYVCGYGIVIRKESEAVTDCLNGINWTQYSNLAAHNCRHISMYHIRQALTDNGFTDG